MAKFFAYHALCYFGVGETEEEAELDMRKSMDETNTRIQNGEQVVGAKAQVLAKGDPGGGGPCAAVVLIEPSDIVFDVRAILRASNGNDDD